VARSKADQILQLKVTLTEVEPPVWRRLLVPADVTLAKLHDALQDAMGWTNIMHKPRKRGASTSNHHTPSAASSAAATKPPSTPSQVLPGLTRGASLLRPKLRPAKYAPTSAATTSRKRNSSSWGPYACRRASASHAGTNTRRPAPAAVVLLTRSGAIETQISASTHHSSDA
jgi:hypothetical protein